MGARFGRVLIKRMAPSIVAERTDALASLALTSDQQVEVMRIVDAGGTSDRGVHVGRAASRYCLFGPLISAFVHTPTGTTFRFEFLENPNHVGSLE